tara:strand:- start:68 stop:553 length:486 start_codon:yes stop_codon:yes gene_type:complete
MPDKDLCLLKIGGRWKDGIPRAPWSRYIPPCINYEKFSKEDLDMRRKAYVLNYNQRNSRPKKNDAYIYFSKHPINKNRSGKTTASNKYFKLERIGLYSCKLPTEAPKKTYPTTASDVPGNVMQLYVDEKVPVTMINTTRNYGTSEGNYPEKPSKIGLQFTY